MDPVANLVEQKYLAEMIQKRQDEGRLWDEDEIGDQLADAARLAELVLALNDWRLKGGFLPAIAA